MVSLQGGRPFASTGKRTIGDVPMRHILASQVERARKEKRHSPGEGAGWEYDLFLF